MAMIVQNISEKLGIATGKIFRRCVETWGNRYAACGLSALWTHTETCGAA